MKMEKKQNGGCSWLVWVAIIILFIYIIGSNSNDVPQQPVKNEDYFWEVVYPQFRTDISDQLLNTQQLIGSTKEDVILLRNQNADIQYSLEILLSELGIFKGAYENESRKQWLGQIGLTIMSICLGWLLGAIVPTRENLDKVKDFINKDRSVSILRNENVRSFTSRYHMVLGALLIFLIIILVVAIGFTVYYLFLFLTT